MVAATPYRHRQVDLSTLIEDLHATEDERALHLALVTHLEMSFGVDAVSLDIATDVARTHDVNDGHDSGVDGDLHTISLIMAGRPVGRLRVRRTPPFDDAERESLRVVGLLVAGTVERLRLGSTIVSARGDAAEYARRLEILNEASHALVACTSDDDVWQVCGVIIPTVVASDRLSLGTVDTWGRTLTLRTVGRTGAESSTRTMPLRGTALGEAIRSGELLATPDLRERSHPDAKSIATQGFRSSLVMPLAIGGSVNAAIAVSSRRVAAYSTQDQQVFATFLRMVQTALDRLDALHQLERQARRDPLTGLYNRRAFDRQLVAAVDAAGSGRSTVLAVIDVDHFKRVNDEAGHAAGDAVLCDLSGLLVRELGEHGEIARVGGDEFSVLLRDIDIDAAVQRLNSLRRRVADHPFSWGGHEFAVSLSIGVVEVNPSGAAADVQRLADKACYQAKGRGRNAVVAG